MALIVPYFQKKIQTQLQQFKLKFSKSEEALKKSLEDNKLNEVIIENKNIELNKVQSNCESCKESNNRTTSQSHKTNFG